MNGKKNAGQAYTEYVIVVLMVSLALLARDTDSGQPYIGLMIAAIKQHYQGYAASVALPELPASSASK
jgi:hypothetical protein